MSNTGLITTIIWHDNTYLVKLNVLNNYLEINIVDQQSGEEWQCNYDHLYVENLTHKTGNFKPFDTFVAMLKAGLLKTRNCVSLDLFTYEDLESLCIRRFQSQAKIQNSRKQNSNRRYLILNYNSDFDRINYPIPLEYCGPPDPHILQATIKRLESDLLKTRNELKNKEDSNSNVLTLQKRTEQLENENYELKLQLRYQNHRSPSSRTLRTAFSQLERIVQSERKSHLKLVEQMRFEKVQLLKTIEKLKASEKSLKSQLSQVHSCKRLDCGDTSGGSRRTLNTLYRRSRSLSQESVRSNMDNLYNSPNGSIVLQTNMKARMIKKQSRKDVNNTSTSSLCSSLNNFTNRKVKHASRNSSRSSSKGSRHYSTASQSSVNESPCRLPALKLSQSTRNKTGTCHALLKPIKHDKFDFTDLEKKVSSLQRLLNTKRIPR